MILRKCILLGVFASLIFCTSAFGEELHLVKDKLYLLMFNDEIENYNYNKDCMDAQIVHTIFDDRKQMIISLKRDCRSFLQVKTTDEMHNYEIINAKIPSKELLEIDFPPIENLDVDIYTGD